jgi:Putative amidoligase enzyme
MSTTVQQIWGLNDSKFAHLAPFAKERFTCGAELEIEDINLVKSLPAGVDVVDDNSLRNGGREFLTGPRHLEDCVSVLANIHKGIQTGNKKFTERTSTHVHVNVMYYTQEQVKTLLYLYSIFEPLTFNFVGEARKKNIHCVPLEYTTMHALFKRPIDFIASRWHKYSALNLKPLSSLGTVEFRHLEGTDDVERFEAWLKFLRTLWEISGTINLTRQNLIDLTLLKEIESQLTTPEFKKQWRTDCHFQLEQNLIDVKIAFL